MSMNAFFIDSPHNGTLRQTEIPTPKEDELLLRVMAAGLCGTDIHIYGGEYYGEYPRIPGHEFSGIVEAVGEKVTHFTPGMRVAADPNIFCEGCESCKQNLQNFCEEMQAVGVTRHGAFAEYLVVPQRCAFPIGDLSFTAGAMLEPLACAIHGQNALQIPLGAAVLILGAGPIGLMHLQLSKMNGAGSVTVVDLYESKLALARELGATATYTSPQFEAAELVNHFPVVIDCTGIPKVIEGAVRYVKDAGQLLLFGVCPNDSEVRLNPYEIFKRELRIMGTFALRKTFGAALQVAKSGQVQLERLVGNKITLAEAPALFCEIASKGNSGLKVMAYPNPEDALVKAEFTTGRQK